MKSKGQKKWETVGYVAQKLNRERERRKGEERATSKTTVLEWESALLSSSPCWGLCWIGGHEEDCTSQNQIPLEHSTAPSQHTVIGCSTAQQTQVTEHGKVDETGRSQERAQASQATGTWDSRASTWRCLSQTLMWKLSYKLIILRAGVCWAFSHLEFVCSGSSLFLLHAAFRRRAERTIESWVWSCFTWTRPRLLLWELWAMRFQGTIDLLIVCPVTTCSITSTLQQYQLWPDN